MRAKIEARGLVPDESFGVVWRRAGAETRRRGDAEVGEEAEMAEDRWWVAGRGRTW